MCTTGCVLFGHKYINRSAVAGKRVLDVGSYDVNGSLRDIVVGFKPAEWVGVDLKPCDHASHAPCVTVVDNAENLIARFGTESFDMVISTEMLEHVVDWKKIIHNLKGVLKKECSLILTTRSPGFKFHEFPADHWRFSQEDMKTIFSDCKIDRLESDPYAPGVFVKVTKLLEFNECDLTSYEVTQAPKPPGRRPAARKHVLKGKKWTRKGSRSSRT